MGGHVVFADGDLLRNVFSQFTPLFLVKLGPARLFATAQQLAEHIQAAGYELDIEHLEPGLRLALPCRVVTRRSENGKGSRSG